MVPIQLVSFYLLWPISGPLAFFIFSLDITYNSCSHAFSGLVNIVNLNVNIVYDLYIFSDCGRLICSVQRSGTGSLRTVRQCGL